LATVSPDGKWIAYTSNETGRREVYIQSFPEPGLRSPVSNGGGMAPVWSPGGDELFYVIPPGATPTIGGATVYSGLVAVAVESGATPGVGDPELLFDTGQIREVRLRNYDVSPDAKRFVMVTRTPVPPVEAILVQNWHQELPERVPIN
jgi:hypothetical protein